MIAPENLIPFTFPVSGETLLVKRVSLGAINMSLRRQYPKPFAPVQKVEVGPGRFQNVTNFHDPEYKSRVETWNSEINQMTMEVALKRCLHRHLNEEQKKKVSQFLKENPEMVGTGEDFDIYLEQICFAADADIVGLAEFIRTDGEPTEEAVEATLQSFPGDVR
jgi:hypothetical protein